MIYVPKKKQFSQTQAGCKFGWNSPKILNQMKKVLKADFHKIMV